MAMREILYDTKPLPEEPDDLVVINPTRPNEPDGAIRVYRKEGVLVFDGKQIPIGKIVDGCVSNSNNNPYLPVSYHILLGMDDKNIVHIPVGQDFRRRLRPRNSRAARGWAADNEAAYGFGSAGLMGTVGSTTRDSTSRVRESRRAWMWSSCASFSAMSRSVLS